MAAITLGVAEVEERLRALRRRLNLLTLQHGMYLSLSAVALAATLLIIAALRVSPQTFAIAVCGGGVLGGGAALGSVLYARRRWLDISQAALLADHRGQLADRLATLVDLRTRLRSARLAPVLVGQILALGSRWQPSHIAPRRIPRSLYVLIASVLCLAATLFLARPPRPPSALPRTEPATVADVAREYAPHAPASAARKNGQEEALSGGLRAMAPEAASDSGAGPAGAPALPDVQEDGDAPTQAIAGRLQQAIRHALNPQAPDDTPAQLARSEITSGDSGEGDADRHAGDRNRGADTSHNRHGIPEPESGRDAADHEQRSQSQAGEAAPQNGDAAGQTFQGASPAAGSGSSPRRAARCARYRPGARRGGAEDIQGYDHLLPAWRRATGKTLRPAGEGKQRRKRGAGSVQRGRCPQ